MRFYRALIIENLTRAKKGIFLILEKHKIRLKFLQWGVTERPSTEIACTKYFRGTVERKISCGF